MKNYTSIAESFQRVYPRMSQYRVLEVGSDRGGGLLGALAPMARELVGINIVGAPRKISDNACFEIGDIRNTRFPDNHFDLVVSYAVFEHVSDFGIALSEIRRILKPGGELYTVFGPIFSCMWGHHLWLKINDLAYTYPNPPFVPPYCHLLMTATDLAAKLSGQVPREAITKITDYVFESSEQNRLHHSDYVRFFEESGLRQLKLNGLRNLKLETAYLNGRPIEPYLAELVDRYGQGDYLTATLVARFQKDDK